MCAWQAAQPLQIALLNSFVEQARQSSPRCTQPLQVWESLAFLFINTICLKFEFPGRTPPQPAACSIACPFELAIVGRYALLTGLADRHARCSLPEVRRQGPQSTEIAI